MKAISLFLILSFISISAYTQIKNDTTSYVLYKDKFGKEKKAVVAYPPQILIVDQDSIYTVSTETQLQHILEKQTKFNIIDNSDSIRLFLRSRIKAIIILDKRK